MSLKCKPTVALVTFRAVHDSFVSSMSSRNRNPHLRAYPQERAPPTVADGSEEVEAIVDEVRQG